VVVVLLLLVEVRDVESNVVSDRRKEPALT